MAYYLYKGEEERQMQFMVDKESEMSDLPTTSKVGANGHDAVSAGSIAICIESGELYILNSSDEWTKQ